MSELPLVVDLDGTLLRSDLLHESLFALVRQHPGLALAPLAWVWGGRAAFKARIAQHAALDATSLPYDAAVLDLLRAEKSKGRRLVLATASFESYARAVAAHLDLFDEVIASSATHNLKAAAKRDALLDRYGEKGFDYIGNDWADVPVWAAARQAYLVNPSSGVERRARAGGNVAQVLRTRERSPLVWLKALRLHQWAKNALIFVPLVASHRFGEPGRLADALLAFVLFGLCASSAYLLNDLLDLEDDRHHSSKRRRPFASGALSLAAGAVMTVVLLVLSFGLALPLLPAGFTATLAGYLLLTLSYSLALKRHVVLDVMTLTALYAIRIVAGAFAIGSVFTFWLLGFSIFIFTSLAFVKRSAELLEAQQRGTATQTRGRGYFPQDLGIVSAMGVAAGYVAVLVLALYIQDPATAALYRHPKVIWLACPLLLFWISRIWMLTHRGEMHHDPVVFAIKDRVSLLIGALFGLTFWLAA